MQRLRRARGHAAGALAGLLLTVPLAGACDARPAPPPQPIPWSGAPVTPWSRLELVAGPSGSLPDTWTSIAWHEGFVGLETSGAADGRAALREWRSRDGVEWQLGDAPPGEPGDDCVIEGAPAGFAAICGGSGDKASTWWTADGDAWSRSGNLPVAASGLSVASGDRGLLAVATGRGESAHGWYSADGRSWESTTIDAAGTARAAAAGADGFVVVGDADGTEAIWTSSDGRQWAKARLPFTHAGRYLNEVGIAGRGVLALGGEPAFAWTSRNAVDWSPLDVPDTERWRIAGSDGRRIIVPPALGNGVNQCLDGRSLGYLSFQDVVSGAVTLSPDGMIVATPSGWRYYRAVP